MEELCGRKEWFVYWRKVILGGDLMLNANDSQTKLEKYYANIRQAFRRTE